MAQLFGTTRQNVNLHLQNTYEEGEIDREATRKDFLQVRREGSRNVQRSVAHHSLDAVLSVGYRVRSSSATAFRRWANHVLRRYILEGAAVNDRRLAELGALTEILSRSRDENVSGLADVLHRYTSDFNLLNSYDKGEFDATGGTEPTWDMDLAVARDVVAVVSSQFPSDHMFGAERGDGLLGIIAQVEQTSFGEPLYPTVEDRAANLIYLTVKNHPFADGNKRSAAAIASVYLERNGVSSLPPNTLAALTLIAASSEAAQKDQIIGVLRTVLVGSGK